MVRRYDDEVQVRPAPGWLEGGLEEPEPDAFVWRGRLYVVRAVLARWHERRAWWRDPAAAALLGLQADAVPASSGGWLADTSSSSTNPSSTGSSSTGSSSTGSSSAYPSSTGPSSTGPSSAADATSRAGALEMSPGIARGTSSSALAGECQVWRVEAAAGRSSPLGVYDLVHTPGVSSTWHLARVAD